MELTNKDFDLAIPALEVRMLAEPQASCPVYHHFGPGVYIRELHMKAGTLAIGHEQRYPHLNVVIKGRVSMFLPDGSTREIGPGTFVGQPGRKVGHVLEDTVWQNIYATNETDIDKLEEMFLIKSDAWKQHFDNSFYQRFLSKEADRLDYDTVIAASGFTPEEVERQVLNPLDQLPPPTNSHLRVLSSPIHGKGLFTSVDIPAGEVICLARVEGYRTIGGRYTNHSIAPNAIMVETPYGDVNLVALTDIKGCQGGDFGEEITVCYRQALGLSGINIPKEA